MHLDDLTTTSRVICTLEPKASDSRKLTAVSSCAPKQLLLESSDRFFLQMMKNMVKEACFCCGWLWITYMCCVVSVGCCEFVQKLTR